MKIIYTTVEKIIVSSDIDIGFVLLRNIALKTELHLCN